MLFQRSTYSHTFECYHLYFKTPLGTVFLWNKHLQSSLFSKVLSCNSSCNHPFDEKQDRRANAATYSLKLTVFLQNKNWSKEISRLLIMIPPWSQERMYWKKSVIWRHQLQSSIFSMVVSLFHASTWSDPYVKDIVFISQYFLQSSIIASGLWSRKFEGWCVYLRKAIVALLF